MGGRGEPRTFRGPEAQDDGDGLIDVAVSSSQHGYMKPHPSIFAAALAARLDHYEIVEKE